MNHAFRIFRILNINLNNGRTQNKDVTRDEQTDTRQLATFTHLIRAALIASEWALDQAARDADGFEQQSEVSVMNTTDYTVSTACCAVVCIYVHVHTFSVLI